MLGHVTVGEKTAVAPHVGVDGAGDVAFIKGVAAAFGDLFESVRQIGVPEDFSFLGGTAPRQEGFLETGPFLQVEGALPGGGDHFRYGEPFPGVAYGRGQNGSHRQLAEFLMKRKPAGDSAGN